MVNFDWFKIIYKQINTIILYQYGLKYTYVVMYGLSIYLNNNIMNTVFSPKIKTTYYNCIIIKLITEVKISTKKIKCTNINIG